MPEIKDTKTEGKKKSHKKPKKIKHKKEERITERAVANQPAINQQNNKQDNKLIALCRKNKGRSKTANKQRRNTAITIKGNPFSSKKVSIFPESKQVFQIKNYISKIREISPEYFF